MPTFSDNISGKAVIFSAPSGAGKTTIVKHLLTQDLDLAFSVSACSREKRPGETEGKDYYFLSVPEFRERINSKDFLEWEEVYKDHYYGTLKSEIERIWKQGKHVIFDVDVVGGLNLKKKFGDAALAVFVLPPSLEALETRLRSRKTESEERIATRMAKAEKEMKAASSFDLVLVNEDLSVALEEAQDHVSKFLNA